MEYPKKNGVLEAAKKILRERTSNQWFGEKCMEIIKKNAARLKYLNNTRSRKEAFNSAKKEAKNSSESRRDFWLRK